MLIAEACRQFSVKLAGPYRFDLFAPTAYNSGSDTIVVECLPWNRLRSVCPKMVFRFESL